MENIDYSCASDRVVVNLKNLGIQDIPAVGRHVYSSARHCLEEHTHGPDLMEIVYLDRGRQIFTVGQEEFTMTGGDLFLTLPGETHGTGVHPEERGVMYWVIVRQPAPGALFLGQRPELMRHLFSLLLHADKRVISGKRSFKSSLDTVIACYEQASDPLSILAIENYLMRFLLDVASCIRSHPKKTVSEPIGRLLEMIERRLDDPPAVSELASACKLSLSRFKSRFKQEVGCPPCEYMMNRRIERSKRMLLETDSPVTSVAMDLGFCSSQYFAQVFRRNVGLSPSMFREQARSNVG